ncbi:hypothetical protein SAMN05421538_1218 [Paracoccus isoporae]|uniref:DUF2059 domain-containing protein n=1 Tax=Paracoccus isoporae TaxID=591205 RepID=A0A1G7HFM2_9RHOB|nr:hypothetical protein [Paracoccus isoporae]SDE99178.1 hypothetical protein SAMN05421538_1218 [Paracoccus isoporae]
MRQIRIAAAVLGALLAAGLMFPLAAAGQTMPSAIRAMTDREDLAERLCARAACAQLSLAIAAESGMFADRVGAAYLGGSGDDWRAEVARVHDPARISALLLARLEGRLTPALISDPALQAALGATGVSADSDARGLELAARAELQRNRALRGTLRRWMADRRADAGVLRAIRALIDEQGMIGARVASGMNRQIAAARGFASAGGYGFPISLQDVAADLSLQLPEWRAEAELHLELSLYAAYAPLGAGAIDRIARARGTAPSRLLSRLVAGAEAEVLDQLAEETGRAAARRLRGTPL